MEMKGIKKSKQFNEGYKVGIQMMCRTLCGRYPNSASVLKTIKGTAEVLLKNADHMDDPLPESMVGKGGKKDG